jgi:hypothetical protein
MTGYWRTCNCTLGPEEFRGIFSETQTRSEKTSYAGLPNGCYLLQLSLTMSDGTHLTTWVTRETKERFAAVARHQGLSDSALLKRLVELTLQTASAGEVVTPAAADRTPRDSRLSVRIRPDDQLLLRERAAARGMATATYVSVLTRSHLRSLAPLPKAEWLTLEKIVTELSKLGRNINQIARVANRGERVTTSGSDHFRAMFTICQALRVNTKRLLQANAKSWQQGYEDQK